MRFGGVVAVDDVSFTVKPGEVVGLIGPNGAGKTTLIDAITGFSTPTAGAVLARRRAIESLSADAARPRRHRPLVPVARAVRGHDACARTCASASDRRDHAAYSPISSGPATRRSRRRRSRRSRSSSSSDDLDRSSSDLPYGRRRLRRRSPARSWPSRRCSCSTSRPPASTTPRPRSSAHLVRRLADEWGIAILVVEHDMSTS